MDIEPPYIKITPPAETSPSFLDDSDWIRRNQKALLQKYGECSIIVSHHKVIGIGATYDEAVEDVYRNLPDDIGEISPIHKRLRHSHLIRQIAIISAVISGFLAVCFIAFISFMAYVVGGLGDILNSPLCDPQNPAGIQDVARIELPPSYSNLQSSCGGMMGWGAEASFDIDPDELDIFLASTSIERPLSSTEVTTHFSYISQQEIENLDSYLYGVYDSYEWFEEVIVDTSNQNRWIVYFKLLAG
jgi:hypothetical protein